MQLRIDYLQRRLARNCCARWIVWGHALFHHFRDCRESCRSLVEHSGSVLRIRSEVDRCSCRLRERQNVAHQGPSEVDPRVSCCTVWCPSALRRTVRGNSSSRISLVANHPTRTRIKQSSQVESSESANILNTVAADGTLGCSPKQSPAWLSVFGALTLSLPKKTSSSRSNGVPQIDSDEFIGVGRKF